MLSQQYFGLTLLFVINTINFLDRLSVAAVLSKIQDYYSYTKFQSGLLSTAFLGGYMLTAPIFGYLGDKYSRKYILIGGVGFWLLAAFSGSLMSRDHGILFFISRMLVGVGEASYSTIAPTIIADLFEPHRRKVFLSIFYFAIPIGSGLGFLVGNLALQLNDWRWICRITPAIGVVATLLLFLLEEPVRGQSDGAQSESLTKDDATIVENLKYLKNIKSYVWMTIGFTCCLFAMGALSWWSIGFMGVAKGEDYESTATIIFGVVVFGAGFLGVILGSSAAQYFRKYDARSDPIVCAVGVFLAVPLTFFGLVFARSYTSLSWLLLFLSVTALSTNWAVVSDMVLSITLPNKRAFATAIQILTTHLLGDAASPFIVGGLRDELKPRLDGDDYHAFLYALLSTLIILFFGALAFARSAKYYAQDVEHCRALVSQKSEGEDVLRSDGANLTDFAS